jgi:hypothetical protein
MRAFNVYLAGKKIDTVFYSGQGTATVDREEVRTSLVNHDGYDTGITVRENHKMTKHTEFVIQGSYGQGWEDENTELTRADGVRSLREYRENMPQYPHRMITRTVEND